MTQLPHIELPEGCSKVLLHCCCAPCSGAIVEAMVKSGIRPVLYFSNSNINTPEEYGKRLDEVLRYASLFDLEVVNDTYAHKDWLAYIKGLEDAPERGSRCLECFRFRLSRAAAYAAANGFDTLATTLASSRWKDLNQVDEAGRDACSKFDGVYWWGRSWRKEGLQPRRSEIIAEQNFYNQTYCGCEFSLRIDHIPVCHTV